MQQPRKYLKGKSALVVNSSLTSKGTGKWHWQQRKEGTRNRRQSCHEWRRPMRLQLVLKSSHYVAFDLFHINQTLFLFFRIKYLQSSQYINLRQKIIHSPFEGHLITTFWKRFPTRSEETQPKGSVSPCKHFPICWFTSRQTAVYLKTLFLIYVRTDLTSDKANNQTGGICPSAPLQVGKSLGGVRRGCPVAVGRRGSKRSVTGARSCCICKARTVLLLFEGFWWVLEFRGGEMC